MLGEWLAPTEEQDKAVLASGLFPQLPTLDALAESPLYSQYTGEKGVCAYY